MLEVNGYGAPYRRMPLTSSPDKAEQRLLGEALRMIREDRKKLQKDVAEALGVKTQTWSLYEKGERGFTADRIADVLRILGASEYDLDVAKARVLGAPERPRGIEDRRSTFVFDVFGRARAGARGPEIYDVAEPLRRIDLGQILGRATDALQVAGDSMSPWAESGEIVLFDRERPPRRGGGCVVELNNGDAHVKIYEKSDGSTLFVRELFPEERTITFALKDVRGVYPVTLRGD
jgi:phage repressor protein C with HTH and peptisase S24 domain